MIVMKYPVKYILKLHKSMNFKAYTNLYRIKESKAEWINF